MNNTPALATANHRAMRRAARLATVTVSAAVLTLMAACGDVGTATTPGGQSTTAATSQTAQRIAENRELWQNSGVSDYTWTVQMDCYYCPPSVSGARVVDGEVIDWFVSELDHDEPVTTTMEALFDRAERAENNGHLERVDFDQQTGQITGMHIDMQSDQSHMDATYIVRLTENPEETPQLTADDFGHDLPCGNGFAAGDADGTVVLEVHRSNPLTSWQPEAVLADHEVKATLTFGTDLTNNWCADLIVEPAPTIETEWSIATGRLTFDGEVPEEVGVEVTGLLTDMVAVSTSGDFMVLPDLEITNEAWLFLPG